MVGMSAPAPMPPPPGCSHEDWAVYRARRAAWEVSRERWAIAHAVFVIVTLVAYVAFMGWVIWGEPFE